MSGAGDRGAPRRRRTELTTPAHRAELVRKAVSTDADVVVLDLEDSVPPTLKGDARAGACAALRHQWAGTSVAVRVNGFGSGHLLDDLDALTAAVSAAPDAQLDFLVVPKVRSAADVLWIGRYLDERAAGDRPIGIEVLVEDAAGLLAAGTLASAHPRVEALVLGPVDYLASLGCPDVTGGGLADVPAAVLDHARQHLLVAARAQGVAAIDTAYPAYRDTAGLDREARAAHRSGFDGKWVIHPGQVPVVNAAFTPGEEQVARARTLVARLAAGAEDGLGAIGIDGGLVDAAHVRAARALLARVPVEGAP